MWQSEYSGEDVEYLLRFFTSFPSKQRGSYMFQRSVIGGLWCAAVVPLSFLSAVSCPPPPPQAQGSLTEADSSQALKFSMGAIVWQQLNYCNTSHNQLGCREYRHLFSTDGQGIAVGAQYSTQVTAAAPNAWVIWLIQGSLRGKDCSCVTLLYGQDHCDAALMTTFTSRLTNYSRIALKRCDFLLLLFFFHI